MPKTKRFKLPWRVIITVLMMIIQILFIVFTTGLLQKDFLWLYSAFELLGVATVIYIVNKKGNPSYKIAWIVFILALPVFGILVYLLWGGQRTLPHQKKKMARCEAHFIPSLKEDSAVKEMITYESNVLSRHTQFLTNDSGFPVYSNTNVEYLSPGEVFYPRFLEELQKAKKYIFIEFFIIAEGKMWEGVEEILLKKASEGVEIKIIFDDFGSMKRQNKRFISKLKKHGISIAAFNPIKPPFNMFMNNRNHRKLVVIDGNVSFTGGINIGDEYINAEKRFGYWMDNAVLIKGKATDSFVAMFAIMWEYITNEQLKLEYYLLSKKEDNESYVFPYCDGPMNTNHTAQGLYMQILNTAHRYVYIATPYLILDSNMTAALVMAARSGIDVKICTPFIPDKNYVHPASQFHYAELLDAGVRIFEYKPGFMHSKLFICDDMLATSGSVNMDYRSFVFHFECGVWFTNSETIAEMKAHFNKICDESYEIKSIEWNKRGIFRKSKEWFLHLFSPLM